MATETTEDSEPKNISENNQDSNNNNQDSNNNNQDSNNKE